MHLRKDIAGIVKKVLIEQGSDVNFEDMDLFANNQFFLWHTWFYDVFSRPSKEGFDIVIGNPPYGATISNSEKRIYKIVYPETQFKIDTYSLLSFFL